MIPPNQAGATLTIYAWNSDLDPIEAASAIRQDERESPSILIRGDPRRSADVITLSGKRGNDGNGDPYVIDTIPVPFENPYGSPMFLTGLDFFENGDAAISTFFGDVWIVRGLDHDLGEVTWKRVAKGLNQPLGLLVIDGKIHTLGKYQITALHDLNGDEVADFYENFCNAYVTSPGSHDYNTGFQRDDAGYLYFATKHAGVIKVSPDGKTVRSLGAGLRNPNGIGVAPDGRVWCSPQEGQWTPASQIVRIEPDGYYGFQKHIDNKERTGEPIGTVLNPGGSLVATPTDVARKLLLHRDRGRVAGKQIVPAEILQQMYKSQPGRGKAKYGLGFNILKQRTDGSASRIQHTGASGTIGIIDFDIDLIVIVLTQVPQAQTNKWRGPVLKTVFGAFEE